MAVRGGLTGLVAAAAVAAVGACGADPALDDGAVDPVEPELVSRGTMVGYRLLQVESSAAGDTFVLMNDTSGVHVRRWRADVQTWDEMATLPVTDAPVMAVDADGDAVVAWRDGRAIDVSRFTAGSAWPAGWSAPTRLVDVTDGLVQAPAAAASGHGAMVVGWQRTGALEPGATGSYLALSDGDAGWLAPHRIGVPATGEAPVAVADLGATVRIAAASASSAAVYGEVLSYDPATATWTSDGPARLDVGGATWAALVGVGLGVDGDATALFHTYDGDGETVIASRHRGGAWAPAAVRRAPPGGEFVRVAALAADPATEVLAWPWCSSGCGVLAWRRTVAGWGDPAYLTAPSGPADQIGAARVATAGGRAAVLCGTEDRTEEGFATRLWMAWLVGERWGTERSLAEVAPGDGWIIGYDLSMAENGGAAAWTVLGADGVSSVTVATYQVQPPTLGM